MFSSAYSHFSRPQDKASLPGFPQIDLAQRAWEISQLTNLFNLNQPKHILEIGTYQGGTLYGWLKFAPVGARIVTIDLEEPRPEWEAWYRDEELDVHHLLMDSHQDTTLEIVKGLLPEIDFLFIDADHTEAGATQDFEMYGPLVRSGGLIAFHDILDPAPARQQDHVRVSRLWKRIQRAGYITQEFVCHPEQEWGGIGVVYK